MTLNQIGAACGVLAFVAIMYLHGCKEVVIIPTPHEMVETPKISTPAPKIEPKVEKPVERFPKVVPCIGDGKCGPRSEVKPARSNKAILNRTKPVYHKVLKNGEIDGKIDCKEVPTVAHEYPPAKVIEYAKEMGLSPEKLAQLRVCLN